MTYIFWTFPCPRNPKSVFLYTKKCKEPNRTHPVAGSEYTFNNEWQYRQQEEECVPIEASDWIAAKGKNVNTLVLRVQDSLSAVYIYLTCYLNDPNFNLPIFIMHSEVVIGLSICCCLFYLFFPSPSTLGQSYLIASDDQWLGWMCPNQ